MKDNFGNHCSWCGEGEILSQSELDNLSAWDRNECIVKKHDGSYKLFLPCADHYYDAMIGIRFCHWCGRKLGD